MSRLDDIKGAYDNIQVPVELKERVLQSMEQLAKKQYHTGSTCR